MTPSRTDSPLFNASGKGALWRNAVICLVLAVVLAGGLFWWQGRNGLVLADEGYLWYGAQRVAAGDLPMRDFMAYDPGRYFWSAAWMKLSHDNGIMSLRAAVVIFQIAGVFAALSLLVRNSRSVDLIFLILAGAVLIMWMYPRHKMFEMSLAIFLVCLLANLLRKPDPLGFLVTGAGIGLVAFFGRNHGVYGLAGALLAFIYLSIGPHRLARMPVHIVYWMAGICLGYLPQILLIAFAPGFVAAFADSILGIFERGTNLPLPVPWPWLVPFATMSTVDSVRHVIVGICFMLLLAFCIGGLAVAMLRRFRGNELPSALVAAIMMGLPYAHYSFSRAALGHLTHGIYPMLIALLLWTASRTVPVRHAIVGALCGISFLVMIPVQPLWLCVAHSCADADVASDRLRLEPQTVSDLALLAKLNELYAPGDRPFLAAPHWPGSYAVLNKKAPVWEIYSLWPRSEAFERDEIKSIAEANVGFVFIWDLQLDGREDLRFRNTHPLTMAFIESNFEKVEGLTPQTGYLVFRSTRPYGISPR